MARISQDTIDRIRDTADILDVVSDYVELRRRGRNSFGFCPFHSEKTPSFSVAPDKQIFHCFGCGTGGNVITFLMEYEKISFVEALQKLAQRYGIELMLTKDDTSKEFFSHLYDIHALAEEHYRKNLKSRSGDQVRQYLSEDRNLSPSILDQFSVGLAGKGWDSLYSKAKAKEFSDDVMEQCGLFTKTEKGIFDRFRNRIMFPITNLAGRVVAFAGRDLEGSSDAKYLNSPETPVYAKSDILYGFSETKEAIRKEQSAIVVEGYTDFLQLYQNNILNVVAVAGTAFTARHVNQVRKFASTAYLAYDGDAPGRKAAIAAGYHLLRGGLTPQIVELPLQTDPDGWVKEKGPAPFLKAVKNSAELIEFHLANCGIDLSSGPNRSRIAREMAYEIAGIPDEIIRQHTIRLLAEELTIDENVLLRIVADRARRRPQRQEAKHDEIEPSLSSSPDRAQMEIVKLLASGDAPTVELLRQQLKVDRFTHPVMKSLASYLLKGINTDGVADPSGAVDQFGKKPERDLASRVLFESSPQTNSLRVAVDCLITLEQSPVKENITQQRLRLRELERNGKDTSTILQEVIRLQKKLEELEKRRAELLSPS